MPERYIRDQDFLADPRFATASLPQKMEALGKIAAYNEGVLGKRIETPDGLRADYPAGDVFGAIHDLGRQEEDRRRAVMADHVAGRVYDVASANDEDPAATLEKIQAYVAGDKSVALGPDEMDAANEWIAANDTVQKKVGGTFAGNGTRSRFSIDTPNGASIGSGLAFTFNGKAYNYLSFDSDAEGQSEQDPTKRFRAIVPAPKTWEVANKELTDQIEQTKARLADLTAQSEHKPSLIEQLGAGSDPQSALSQQVAVENERKRLTSELGRLQDKKDLYARGTEGHTALMSEQAIDAIKGNETLLSHVPRGEGIVGRVWTETHMGVRETYLGTVAGLQYATGFEDAAKDTFQVQKEFSLYREAYGMGDRAFRGSAWDNILREAGPELAQTAVDLGIGMGVGKMIRGGARSLSALAGREIAAGVGEGASVVARGVANAAQAQSRKRAEEWMIKKFGKWGEAAIGSFPGAFEEASGTLQYVIQADEMDDQSDSLRAQAAKLPDSVEFADQRAELLAKADSLSSNAERIHNNAALAFWAQVGITLATDAIGFEKILSRKGVPLKESAARALVSSRLEKMGVTGATEKVINETAKVLIDDIESRAADFFAKSPLANNLMQRLEAGFFEGSTEVLQGVLNNTVTQQFLDENQDIFNANQGASEFGVGMLIGFIMKQVSSKVDPAVVQRAITKNADANDAKIRETRAVAKAAGEKIAVGEIDGFGAVEDHTDVVKENPDGTFRIADAKDVASDQDPRGIFGGLQFKSREEAEAFSKTRWQTAFEAFLREDLSKRAQSGLTDTLDQSGNPTMKKAETDALVGTMRIIADASSASNDVGKETFYAAMLQSQEGYSKADIGIETDAYAEAVRRLSADPTLVPESLRAELEKESRAINDPNSAPTTHPELQAIISTVAATLDAQRGSHPGKVAYSMKQNDAGEMTGQRTERATLATSYESPERVAASINASLPDGYSVDPQISKYGDFSGRVSIMFEGQEVGFIAVDFDHTTQDVRINKSEIDKAHRGKGLAKKTYIAINDALVANGLPPLRSDNRSLTQDAANLWRSLERDGLARERTDGVRGFEFTSPVIGSGQAGPSNATIPSEKLAGSPGTASGINLVSDGKALRVIPTLDSKGKVVGTRVVSMDPHALVQRYNGESNDKSSPTAKWLNARGITSPASYAQWLAFAGHHQEMLNATEGPAQDQNKRRNEIQKRADADFAASKKKGGLGLQPAGVKLTDTGGYTSKDQQKAASATKFIGRGSKGSSTDTYAKDFGRLANAGAYTPGDVVFISSNGSRDDRVAPDFAEISKAIAAGARFVTDDPAGRSRPYNVGEREVADFLRENGYHEASANGMSTWAASPVEASVTPGQNARSITLLDSSGNPSPGTATIPILPMSFWFGGRSTYNMILTGHRRGTTRFAYKGQNILPGSIAFIQNPSDPSKGVYVLVEESYSLGERLKELDGNMRELANQIAREEGYTVEYVNSQILGRKDWARQMHLKYRPVDATYAALRQQLESAVLADHVSKTVTGNVKRAEGEKLDGTSIAALGALASDIIGASQTEGKPDPTVGTRSKLRTDAFFARRAKGTSKNTAQGDAALMRKDIEEAKRAFASIPFRPENKAEKIAARDRVKALEARLAAFEKASSQKLGEQRGAESAPAPNPIELIKKLPGHKGIKQMISAVESAAAREGIDVLASPEYASLVANKITVGQFISGLSQRANTAALAAVEGEAGAAMLVAQMDLTEDDERRRSASGNSPGVQGPSIAERLALTSNPMEIREKIRKRNRLLKFSQMDASGKFRFPLGNVGTEQEQMTAREAIESGRAAFIGTYNANDRVSQTGPVRFKPGSAMANALNAAMKSDSKPLVFVAVDESGKHHYFSQVEYNGTPMLFNTTQMSDPMYGWGRGTDVQMMAAFYLFAVDSTPKEGGIPISSFYRRWTSAMANGIQQSTKDGIPNWRQLEAGWRIVFGQGGHAKALTAERIAELAILNSPELTHPDPFNVGIKSPVNTRERTDGPPQTIQDDGKFSGKDAEDRGGQDFSGFNEGHEIRVPITMTNRRNGALEAMAAEEERDSALWESLFGEEDTTQSQADDNASNAGKEGAMTDVEWAFGNGLDSDNVENKKDSILTALVKHVLGGEESVRAMMGTDTENPEAQAEAQKLREQIVADITETQDLIDEAIGKGNDAQAREFRLALQRRAESLAGKAKYPGDITADEFIPDLLKFASRQANAAETPVTAEDIIVGIPGTPNWGFNLNHLNEIIWALRPKEGNPERFNALMAAKSISRKKRDQYLKLIKDNPESPNVTTWEKWAAARDDEMKAADEEISRDYGTAVLANALGASSDEKLADGIISNLIGSIWYNQRVVPARDLYSRLAFKQVNRTTLADIVDLANTIGSMDDHALGDELLEEIDLIQLEATNGVGFMNALEKRIEVLADEAYCGSIMFARLALMLNVVSEVRSAQLGVKNSARSKISKPKNPTPGIPLTGLSIDQIVWRSLLPEGATMPQRDSRTESTKEEKDDEEREKLLGSSEDLDGSMSGIEVMSAEDAARQLAAKKERADRAEAIAMLEGGEFRIPGRTSVQDKADGGTYDAADKLTAKTAASLAGKISAQAMEISKSLPSFDEKSESGHELKVLNSVLGKASSIDPASLIGQRVDQPGPAFDAVHSLSRAVRNAVAAMQANPAKYSAEDVAALKRQENVSWEILKAISGRQEQSGMSGQSVPTPAVLSVLEANTSSGASAMDLWNGMKSIYDSLDNTRARKEMKRNFWASLIQADPAMLRAWKDTRRDLQKSWGVPVITKDPNPSESHEEALVGLYRDNWRPKSKTTASLYQDDMGDGKKRGTARGKIQLFNGALPKVSFTKDATPSTFIHEMMHWMMNVRGGAQGKRLMEVMLGENEFSKVWDYATNGGKLDPQNNSQRRNIEERVAYGVEQYFGDLGKRSSAQGNNPGELAMPNGAAARLGRVIRRIWNQIYSKDPSVDQRMREAFDSVFNPPRQGVARPNQDTPPVERVDISSKDGVMGYMVEKFGVDNAELAAEIAKAMDAETGAPARTLDAPIIPETGEGNDPEDLATAMFGVDDQGMIDEGDQLRSEVGEDMEDYIPEEAFLDDDEGKTLYQYTPTARRGTRTVSRVRATAESLQAQPGRLARFASALLRFGYRLRARGAAPLSIFRAKLRANDHHTTVEGQMLRHQNEISSALSAATSNLLNPSLEHRERGVMNTHINNAMGSNDANVRAAALQAMPDRLRIAVQNARVFVDGLMEDLVNRGIIYGQGAVGLWSSKQGFFIHRSYAFTNKNAIDQEQWARESNGGQLWNDAIARLTRYGTPPAEADRLLSNLIKFVGNTQRGGKSPVTTARLFGGVDELAPRGSAAANSNGDWLNGAVAEVLGEQTDSEVRFVNTVKAINDVVLQHEMQAQVRDEGLASGWVVKYEDGKPLPKGYIRFNEKKDVDLRNDPYLLALSKGPLAGYAAPADLVNWWNGVIHDEIQNHEIHPFLQAMAAVNGAWKYCKTVLSVTTSFSNAVSSYLTMIGTGHTHAGLGRALAAAMAHEIGHTATGKLIMSDATIAKFRAVYDSLSAVGAVDSGTFAEVMDTFRRAPRLTEMFSTLAIAHGTAHGGAASEMGRRARRFLGKAKNSISGIYRYGDAIFKMAVTMAEVPSLERAFPGKTQDEYLRMAAARANDTMYSFQREPNLLRSFRAYVPVIGPFFSYSYGITRAMTMGLRTAAGDIFEGFARMRAKDAGGGAQAWMGLKRASGLMVVGYGAQALAAFFASKLGWDDDRDKAARKLLPDYDRDGVLVYTNEFEAGKGAGYINISRFLPFMTPTKGFQHGAGLIAGIVQAAMAGDKAKVDETIDKHGTRALMQILAPFLDEQSSFVAANMLIRGVDRNGRKIVGLNDSGTESVWKVLEAYAKEFIPGTVNSMDRAGLIPASMQGITGAHPVPKDRTLREKLLYMMGFKFSELDIGRGLARNVGDAMARAAEAKDSLGRLLKKEGPVSAQEIVAVGMRAKQDADRASHDAALIIDASTKLGYPVPAQIAALKHAVTPFAGSFRELSTQQIKSSFYGVFRSPFYYSKQTLIDASRAQQSNKDSRAEGFSELHRKGIAAFGSGR